MPSAMKQSMLPFSSPHNGSSLMQASSSATAIVIDDSEEEDDIATPPPQPPLQRPRAENSIIVEVPQMRQSARATSAAASSRETSALKKSVPNLNKRMKTENQKEASTTSKKKDLATKKEANATKEEPPKESVLCHHHRSACHLQIRCTIQKESGRCKMRYCCSSLQRVYKQDPEQILKAGRNVLGADLKEHVGSNEAHFIWKCPKCRGNCQCSYCRKSKGMEPLGKQAPNGSHTDADGKTTLSSSSKRLADEKANGEKEKKKVKKTLTIEAVPGASSSLLQTSIEAPNSIASRIETLNKVPAKAPLQQRTFLTPVRKPKSMEMPPLARLQTRLPVSNLMERVWLYESLIRFDLLQIPKHVLVNLDKFDDWTEAQVQLLLEKLICRIADISSIKMKPLHTNHKKLVEAFVATGNDLKRGEAWDAAKKYCIFKESRLVDLEMVDLLPHQRGDTRKVALQTQPASNETLLGGRLTRNRRLAETRALERVKAISRREMESSDESDFSEESEEEESEEEASSGEDPDEKGPRGHRRSQRGMIRRSTRQKAIATKKNSSPQGDTSIEDEKKGNGHGSDEGVVEILQEEATEPIMMPSFEERIAILSALVDVIVQTKQINEEITLGFKTALEIEKASREEEKELLLKHEEAMKLLNDKAPSMTLTEEYQQWKEEKRKLVKKQTYEVLDLRVHTHLHVEAHKSRSGPLGTDVDGNQYWQLSEYVETKPQDPTGRWAWSLLVLGKSFWEASKGEEAPIASKPIETKDNQAKSLSAKTAEEVRDGSVDSEVMVVIDLPLKANTLLEEKGATSERTASRETTLTQAVSPKQKTVEPSIGFTGTDKHEVIGQLIEYIRFRLALREYEELLQYRKKGEAKASAAALIDPNAMEVDSSSHTLEAQAGSSTKTLSGSEITLLQQQTPGLTDKKSEKKQLRDSQTERRKQVEELIKKLDMVRQYYKWHEEDHNDQEE